MIKTVMIKREKVNNMLERERDVELREWESKVS